VLDAFDLSAAGQYTVPEPARSTPVAGNVRAWGVASTLTVASPVCGGRQIAGLGDGQLAVYVLPSVYLYP